MGQKVLRTLDENDRRVDLYIQYPNSVAELLQPQDKPVLAP